MTPQDELTFADFMSARWSPLFRTAYLLTGNRTEAEDLLQTALARTYVRWKGIRDKGAAERLRAPGDGQPGLAPVADERP